MALSSPLSILDVREREEPPADPVPFLLALSSANGPCEAWEGGGKLEEKGDEEGGRASGPNES